MNTTHLVSWLVLITVAAIAFAKGVALGRRRQRRDWDVLTRVVHHEDMAARRMTIGPEGAAHAWRIFHVIAESKDDAECSPGIPRKGRPHPLAGGLYAEDPYAERLEGDLWGVRVLYRRWDEVTDTAA